MGEPGGEVYSTERLQQELIRADLCAIASVHCYEHASRVVDDIMTRFDVVRKPIKEIK